MRTSKIQIIITIIYLISVLVLSTSAWTLVSQKAAAITCENFLISSPPQSSSGVKVPLTADQRNAVCHGITPAQEAACIASPLPHSCLHITHGGLSNYHGNIGYLEKSFTACTNILMLKANGVNALDVNAICNDLNPPE